jgi:hypothetical protein
MDDLNDTKAKILIRVFDGTRRLISPSVRLLITLIDGYGNHFPGLYQTGPEVLVNVPFYNNLQDSYTVIVAAKGYKDGGRRPVKVSKAEQQVADVMLLPRAATFRFRDSDWATLKQNEPALSRLLAQGLTDNQAEPRYDQLVHQQPAALAALMNITAAMAQIVLSPNKTALGYFKEMIWDPAPAQDRFYAYADNDLITQVRQAAAAGRFAEEPHPGKFHPGATLSYKQTEFDEGDVQLTFHEEDTRTIKIEETEVACVKVESDIDYYKDLIAHGLFEVLPNTISKGLSDPEKVYELRWIGGQREGAAFDPPYTIEALWS